MGLFKEDMGGNEKRWHDQDTFWQEGYPTIFTEWIRESAPLERAEAFDAILNYFTSFGYFET